MAQSRGYISITSPGATVEMDTYTCNHCNQNFPLKPRKPPPAHCMTCDRDVCDKPKCHAGCIPFKKKIERKEEEQYQRDQLMRAMG